MSRELITTCGLAFSGKSTVARKVAAALDAELVSYDAINAQRGFDGGKVVADSEWEKTSLMAAGSARAAIANGRGGADREEGRDEEARAHRAGGLRAPPRPLPVSRRR